MVVRSVAGLGIVDIPISEAGDVKPAYMAWKDVLRRVASDPHYRGCVVDDAWHRFSGFESWYRKHYRAGYHLDKDILFAGNRIYGPRTCCYVPADINKALPASDATRGDCPQGVTLNPDGTYRARLRVHGRKTSLGCCETAEAAHELYVAAKAAYLCDIARDHYRLGNISGAVRNALFRFARERSFVKIGQNQQQRAA
jgi:hypothetical protein